MPLLNCADEASAYPVISRISESGRRFGLLKAGKRIGLFSGLSLVLSGGSQSGILRCCLIFGVRTIIMLHPYFSRCAHLAG
jgi:hypothetical protein